ncbi:MAG: DUF4399 domain-containing protein [Hyphomicrobium aestuarii]|nr:DUF4399 domain-containing protein [Hyphomicrobium aestuarii]
MKKAIVSVLAIAAVGLSSLAVSAQDLSKAPAGAKVSFVEPKNGDTVSSPFKVKFGLSGMEISPAGTEKPNSGHHHLLINQKLADPKAGIPADDTHKHYGKGQTEAEITLPAGKHTLQLVLGDHNHIPHDPIVQSEVITITVK